MKWIILAGSNPAALEAQFRSAVQHHLTIRPFVVLDWGPVHEIGLAYDKLANLSLNWVKQWLPSINNLHYNLTKALITPESSGKIDQTTLITSETMLFLGRPSSYDAWDSLQDSNTLGVDLVGSPPVDVTVNAKGFFKSQERRLHYIRTKPAFRYGTVYRTTDILAKAAGITYTSHPHMMEEMNKLDWSSRSVDASFMQPRMREFTLPGEQAAHNYNRGYSLDLETLEMKPNAV